MSNETKKHEQREKAKKKCIKILNISCYIGAILLVLLLLLTGLQSCKSNKGYSSVIAESLPQVENLARTTWHFNDNIDNALGQYDQDYWQVAFQTQAGTHYTYIYIDDYTMRYQNPSGEPYWCYTAQYGWDGVSGQNITFYGDYNYLNYNNAEFIDFLTKSATLVNPLTMFTFNEQFNYNAPLGLNVGQAGLPFLNDLAWVNTSEIIPPATAQETTATLLLLPFYANGRLYNAIKSHFVIARSNNSLYTEDNKEVVQQVKDNLPVYDYMAFAYIEGSSVAYADVVNIRNTTQKEYAGDPVNVYQYDTTWINDGYRRLNFSGYVITGDMST